MVALTSAVSGPRRFARLWTAKLIPSTGRIPYELPVALSVATIAAVLLGAQVIKLLLNWDGYYGFADDFTLSIEAADRWFHGGGFYYSFQLTGPYTVWPWAEIYPPTALLLYLPWLVLPAFLWWAIPIGITSWVVWSWRPRPLAWAAILLLVAWPTTVALVYWGNSGMWFVAGLASATRWGWPGALILIKLGLAPFALVGMWHRSWWWALAGVVAASLLFLPTWSDYFTAMKNLKTDGPFFLYSLSSVPTMAIPLIAWLGRGVDATRRSAVDRTARAHAPVSSRA